jgi:hypothetical protein
MSKGKSIKDFTDAELVKMASDNHIWLNGFNCIRPTTEFKTDLADMILRKLNETEMRDHLGISNMIILTINKS